MGTKGNISLMGGETVSNPGTPPGVIMRRPVSEMNVRDEGGSNKEL